MPPIIPSGITRDFLPLVPSRRRYASPSLSLSPVGPSVSRISVKIN